MSMVAQRPGRGRAVLLAESVHAYRRHLRHPRQRFALEAVLADIATRGVDVTVNLGDILSGPLQPSATAELLMPLNLPTVRGNHERQLLQRDVAPLKPSDRYASIELEPAHWDWIRSLPETLPLAHDVFLCHGTPDSDLKYFVHSVEADGLRAATTAEVAARAGAQPARLILCGHTHLPRIVPLDDGRLVVNPGSVGLQAYDDTLPFPHRVETGSPEARYALAERGPAGWHAEIVTVRYDWECAAALARAHVRPDWDIALTTGTVEPR